jgi:ABC-type nickel/cobalt efflux system permease component RcnA
MLIVGGGAAVTAIVVFMAWQLVRKVRAAWRKSKAERRLASSGGQDMNEHEHDHQHAH